MARPTPKGASEWATVLPVYVGLAIIVASFILYVLANRVSPALLSAAGTLIAVGQGADVVVQIRRAAKHTPALPEGPDEEAP